LPPLFKINDKGIVLENTAEVFNNNYFLNTTDNLRIQTDNAIHPFYF